MRASWWAVGVALWVVGCGSDPVPRGATMGENGILAFTYQGAATDCPLGCAVDHPMAVGVSTILSVYGDDTDRGFSADTSEPFARVLGFDKRSVCLDEAGTVGRVVEPEDPCESWEEPGVMLAIEVEASEPGDFLLDVRDADGDLIDSLPMNAVVPRELRLHDSVSGAESSGSLSLAVGETRFFAPRFFADDGSPVELSRGVSYEIDASGVLAFGDPEADPRRHESSLVIEGVASGVAIVTVRASGFEASISVEVTP